MTSFLEKAKQAQKKEVKKISTGNAFGEGQGSKLNPFGESWEIEYINKGSCMTCEREDIHVSKYNGTCVISDNIFTEKEYHGVGNKLMESVKKEVSEFSTSKEELVESLFDEDPAKTPKSNTKSKKKETKEETIENIKSDFSYSEHPVIALVWGYDGTSKSEQIMKFEPKENTLIIAFEDKLRPLAHKLGFPQENIILAIKYNKKYDISGPSSLQGVRNLINEIKKCKQENKGKFKDIETVALDGISDIRKPFAVLEWLKEHPDRQKPMNWGDWGEINDKVKNICFSLINLGLVANMNIIFTAQIDWKDDKEVPDCKPWIWHNIQHKFKMIRDDNNHRFYAYCEKSHYDPFWTIDLTDWTHKEKPSLFNILQDPKLIEKYTEECKKEQEELAEKKLSGDVFG